ncbi:MAG: hypothetical protein AB1486_04645 [Planctomycetota bacterium]
MVPGWTATAPTVLGGADRALTRKLLRDLVRQRWPSAVVSGDPSCGDPSPSLPSLSTGFPDLDALLPGQGVPRGRLTEISGASSSGKTSVVFSLVAATLARHEPTAYVDAGGTFFPPAAEQAGIPLDSLLWIRLSPAATSSSPDSNPPSNEGASNGRTLTGRARGNTCMEALTAADLLVRSQSFALLVVDLGRCRAGEATASRKAAYAAASRKAAYAAASRKAAYAAASRKAAYAAAAHASHPARALPPAALFRLARLAREAGTALVLVTEARSCQALRRPASPVPESSSDPLGDPASPSSVSSGSAISLRLFVRRRAYRYAPSATMACAIAGYRVRVEVQKNKHGQGGQGREVEFAIPQGWHW